MYICRAFIVYVALYFSGCKAAHEVYKGQQVWRVDAHTEEGVLDLKELLDDPSIMVERHKFPKDNEGNAYLRVTRQDLKRVHSLLRTSGMSHEIVVRDVKKQLDLEDRRDRRWRKKRSTDEDCPIFDYSCYHTLGQIEEWMDILADKYDFIEKRQIGESLEGRPLSVLRIGSGTEKPIFYMDAAIHAREWIAPATLMYVCNQILTNASYARLLEKLDFYFVPVVNLDGFDYTWTHQRLWRKTRRPYNGSSDNPICVGVDANRNWDINFAGAGASHDPCSVLYHGPSAESEPVVHHLANFLRGQVTGGTSKIKALVSFHNWGQQILYPYNYNLTKEAPTESELSYVGMKMSEAIRQVNGSEYECGRGAKILYIFSGSTSDWTYEKGKIELSYTLELRDLGNFSFELPAEQILPTGQEIMAAIEVLADRVIEKYATSDGKTVGIS